MADHFEGGQMNMGDDGELSNFEVYGQSFFLEPGIVFYVVCPTRRAVPHASLLCTTTRTAVTPNVRAWSSGQHYGGGHENKDSYEHLVRALASTRVVLGWY